MTVRSKEAAWRGLHAALMLTTTWSAMAPRHRAHTAQFSTHWTSNETRLIDSSSKGWRAAPTPILTGWV